MKTRTLLIAALCAFIVPVALGASNAGKRYPSEMRTMTDRVTGATLTVLTASSFSDAKPYQTHDTWTADGNWIIFRSTRDGAKNGQIFVVSEITGDIIQLTDDPATNTGSINLSRKEMKLFYSRGGPRRLPPGSVTTLEAPRPLQVIELNIGDLIADSMAGELKAPETYERIVVTLPGDVRDGGLALDADETRLYWGVNYAKPDLQARQRQAAAARDSKGARQIDKSNTDPKVDREANRKRFAEAGKGDCGIKMIDIATGKITDVIKVPFRLGHLQANPWTPGEIIYCHETTGDAVQRIWACNADGSNNRPIYVETDDEWITHETVAGPDELIFNIMGHLPYLREHPTGIAVINLRTKEMKLLGQVEEDMGNGQLGGFWHSNGSPDGKWAVGDTFKGSVYAINRATGKRTMLTTGHKMRPDHTHPIVSKDSKRVLIQSGMLTNGKALNLMVVALPEE
ncbi:oligogalacturonide lyase [Ereboglobus sp. PH5-5]|uniref:oligogalacturonate lyase family protein n=1 Tax=unclassified Ereboglobus TaxID=2626932 RepID=UPI0024054A10|nr:MULTISPECIES: oligogalacturonate lyase family protein [unclassified Ereboglobus]MDF9827672.1 oligogalacturonide lyase [Ereboglobus sp. PH5-10]MDF9832808.1 oligogalacturonide lyase [Ereboglobus sp. PH5-5]